MENLIDLTNVFGAVGALGIASTITLWRAWAKERIERRKDLDQIVEQMELRLVCQQDMLSKYQEMQSTVGKVHEALVRLQIS